MLAFPRRLRVRRGAVTIRSVQDDLRIGLVEAYPEIRGRSDLDAACAQVAAQIGARWPLEWLDGASFGRYLARRIDPGADVVAAIAEIAIADLYLAAAVVAGNLAALAALDSMLTTELPPVLRTVDPSQDAIDETLQLLREKLLVPHEGTMRIEGYSGHGPLGAFLRISALRSALAQRRRIRPELRPADELDEILDLAPNAEVKVLARQLGGDLRAALRTAISAQPARARALLRLYYADGRGVEEIGRVYNVHASTVSRQLAKVRADVLAHTRAELVGRLRTPPSQVDSLLGHVASLEISLESLLRSHE
jgi:RNA polymerase sigma-70 factor (ECF subfamily)